MVSWGCGSVGRALASHVRGQGFESPHLHFFTNNLEALPRGCFFNKIELYGRIIVEKWQFFLLQEKILTKQVLL